LLVDPEGRAYVSSFYREIESDGELRATSIVLVDPDGRASLAAGGLICPNGIALTQDGRTLLVAETLLGRITAFDRAPDGSLGDRRTWAQFATSCPSSIPSRIIASDLLLPDGICLDAEGALWIADAGGSGAVRVKEGGEILARVAVEDMSVYAVALGGDDGRTLFLCAAPPLFTTDYETNREACLLATRVDVAGVQPPGVRSGEESHVSERQ
jgi:sugar lactone lactonase YvrE